MRGARIDILRDRPEVVVVRVAGEIDLTTHERLLESLESAVKIADVEAVGSVIVDLSQTSFLDSTGIKALVEGYRAAEVAGVRYSATGASGLVHRVLEMTGVHALLSAGTDAAGGSA